MGKACIGKRGVEKHKKNIFILGGGPIKTIKKGFSQRKGVRGGRGRAAKDFRG